ncbi:MAG: hypothetical protein J7J31_04310 [Helicobacteraceae bacterium]|nr:hypothetical protein [Helicobacteraceae bacterium]
MYYVIKKQNTNPLSTFIGFKVPKYISSKKSDTVIFEFIQNDKPVRKWVKKEDIILLTDDREYFLKIYKQFEDVQKQQQVLIDKAQANLDKTLETFTETMQDEIDKYTQFLDDSDIPQNLL